MHDKLQTSRWTGFFFELKSSRNIFYKMTQKHHNSDLKKTHPEIWMKVKNAQQVLPHKESY